MVLALPCPQAQPSFSLLAVILHWKHMSEESTTQVLKCIASSPNFMHKLFIMGMMVDYDIKTSIQQTIGLHFSCQHSSGGTTEVLQCAKRNFLSI